MHHAAPVVLVDVGVVVILYAAPVGLAGLSGHVRVVLAGVPDHVKGPLGVVLGQGVQQDVGQGPSVKFIRAGWQVHRPIVKGHGHHPLAGLDALDAAGVADMVFLLRQEFFQHAFACLPGFHDQRHEA